MTTGRFEWLSSTTTFGSRCRDLLLEPERVLDEWSRRCATDAVTAQLRQTRDEAARRLAKEERTLQRLLDAYEANLLELGELRERSPSVRKRVTRARAELENAEASLRETIELREIIAGLDTFAERVRDSLDQLSWEDRCKLVTMLVARVEIDDEGATIVYRIPGRCSVRRGDPQMEAADDRFLTSSVDGSPSPLRGLG